MADAERGGDARMPARLFLQPVARIDQDERQVGGGRTGHHVARVLRVPRRVGDDELALRRGEVAVGHIDGDALLALGAQTVGDEGEVDAVVAAASRRDGSGFELIVEQRLGVVQNSRPMSVLLPSSTEPAVAKRSSSI